MKARPKELQCIYFANKFKYKYDPSFLEKENYWVSGTKSFEELWKLYGLIRYEFSENSRNKLNHDYIQNELNLDSNFQPHFADLESEQIQCIVQWVNILYPNSHINIIDLTSAIRKSLLEEFIKYKDDHPDGFISMVDPIEILPMQIQTLLGNYSIDDHMQKANLYKNNYFKSLNDEYTFGKYKGHTYSFVYKYDPYFIENQILEFGLCINIRDFEIIEVHPFPKKELQTSIVPLDVMVHIRELNATPEEIKAEIDYEHRRSIMNDGVNIISFTRQYYKFSEAAIKQNQENLQNLNKGIQNERDNPSKINLRDNYNDSHSRSCSRCMESPCMCSDPDI